MLANPMHYSLETATKKKLNNNLKIRRKKANLIVNFHFWRRGHWSRKIFIRNLARKSCWEKLIWIINQIIPKFKADSEESTVLLKHSSVSPWSMVAVTRWANSFLKKKYKSFSWRILRITWEIILKNNWRLLWTIRWEWRVWEIWSQ